MSRSIVRLIRRPGRYFGSRITANAARKKAARRDLRAASGWAIAVGFRSGWSSLSALFALSVKRVGSLYTMGFVLAAKAVEVSESLHSSATVKREGGSEFAATVG
jgi:hypothetical protein